MIDFYNITKYGVDTLDQMVRSYTSKRKTNRWPMAFFYNMLDISALNAYVLWLEVDPNWGRKQLFKRRLFIEELGKQLVSAMASTRDATESQQRNDNSSSSSRSSTPINPPASPQPSTSKLVPTKALIASNRGRCSVCPRSTQRKASFRCVICQRLLCGEHKNTLHFCHDHIP